MKQSTSSLGHFTGRERYVLHCIRKQLIKEAKPDLILYLGSLATTTLRRNQSAIEHNATNFRYACELLLVLPPRSTLHGSNENIRALEDQLLAWGDVRLVVFTPEGLARQLQSGRNPRISLHTPAIILYEKDNALRKILKMVQTDTDSSKVHKATAHPADTCDEPSFSPIILTPEELGAVHDTQGVSRQLNRLAEVCHLLWVWQRQSARRKTPVTSVL